MQDIIGTIIDHYKILSLLGAGGMGSVYKAHDITLQRDVAIKVLHPHYAHQADFRERFLREARAAAGLDYPGIVRVYDFGEKAELLYIVMEFIPGSNLKELLKGLRATNRWMHLPEALDLGRQVCLAIAYSHSRGVLHRDIKPDNIMLKLEKSGILPYRPVLTDLGLARLLEEQTITQSGVSMGTPAYMSPEQALGQTTDARSDIYSLGVLLFELATGELPFPAKTITEAIRYHSQELPPRPSAKCKDIPATVEATVLKALEKDPSKRFQTAEGLAKALCLPDFPDDTVIEAATLIKDGEQLTQLSRSTGDIPGYQKKIGPPVKAWIEPPVISVEPGNHARINMMLLSQSDAITEIEISLAGIPLEWVFGLTREIKILPGQSQEFRFVIQPPRTPQSRAGTFPLQFLITNPIAPEHAVEVECTLKVQQFFQYNSILSPLQIEAGQTGEILIENLGNTPDTFVVSLEDQSLALTFEPPQARIAIPDGQIVSIEFRAISQASGILPKKQVHPFIARVTSSNGNEQRLAGKAVIKTGLPIWLSILPVLACLFVIILVGLLPFGPQRQPWLIALVVRTATPTVTATLTSSPAPTSSPRPPSTLTPTSALTPTLIQTSTVTPTQVDLAAGKKPWMVLWDLSHGPRQSETGAYYEPDGLYSQLKSLLKDNDIILDSSKDSLEAVDLSKYAMIVIAMTSAERNNYTAAEAKMIAEFVKRGGSLLILAESPGFPNRIKAVTDYYEIDVGQEVIPGAVTRLEDHKIFRNVEELNFWSTGGSLAVRNNQAQIIASQNGMAAIVVIDDLPGRVVVVGDSNLFDNRGLSNNKQFAINLFRWLT